MHNKHVFPSIELLNFEGPVLQALKTKKGFVIIDEDKEVVDVLSQKELYEFIFNGLTIIDSRKRSWLWKNESDDVKPNKDLLVKFVGL